MRKCPCSGCGILGSCGGGRMPWTNRRYSCSAVPVTLEQNTEKMEAGMTDDPAGELALTLGVNESTATRGGVEITAVVAKQRPKVSMMMASW
eukprot:scaffold10108_cov54-Cyclotella_meneghiniana.AAC.1